jgi:hypothetical protein
MPLTEIIERGDWFFEAEINKSEFVKSRFAPSQLAASSIDGSIMPFAPLVVVCAAQAGRRLP